MHLFNTAIKTTVIELSLN